jgi:KAP family P-loop domain
MAESTRSDPGDLQPTVEAVPGAATVQADGRHQDESGSATSDARRDPERAITVTATQVTPPATVAANTTVALTTLADVPLAGTTGDLLGYMAYADALCGLIDNPQTPTPLTIAVNAAWGAGKTSLVNLVTGRLAERTRRRRGREHIVCQFPAWLHDDAPHLGAALAAKVAREASRHRPWRRRLLNPLPTAMLTPEQRWRRRILLGVASLAIAVLVLLPGSVRTIVKPPVGATAAVHALVGHQWAALGVLLLTALVVWPKVFSSAQAAARFVDDPKSEAGPGAARPADQGCDQQSKSGWPLAAAQLATAGPAGSTLQPGAATAGADNRRPGTMPPTPRDRRVRGRQPTVGSPGRGDDPGRRYGHAGGVSGDPLRRA